MSTSILPISEKNSNIISKDFAPLRPYLFATAKRFTNNSNDADELVSKTFERICLKINQYEQYTNAKAFAVTVMKSIFINDYRKKQRVGYVLPIENLSPQKSHLSADYVEEMGVEVRSALKELDDIETKLIQYELDDYSMIEISEMMGMPIGTVKSKLFRVKNKLKLTLLEYGQREYSLKNKR